MVDVIHIRAGRTKHGPGRRAWGQFEYAQAAIGVRAQKKPFTLADVAKHGFKAKLVRAVRNALSKDPAYRRRFKRQIGRNTILRGLEMHLRVQMKLSI
jgi:hypothetical protein